MKREMKREIEYSNGKSTFYGYFHQWLIKKDSKGSEIAYALVEDEEGYILEVSHDMIKFKSK